MIHSLVSEPGLCESGVHAKSCIATQVDQYLHLGKIRGPLWGSGKAIGVGQSGSFLEEESWSRSWHGDAQHGGGR